MLVVTGTQERRGADCGAACALPLSVAGWSGCETSCQFAHGQRFVSDVRAEVCDHGHFFASAAVGGGRNPRPGARTQYGTLSRMAKIVPVREFRTKLSELLSDVADRRDHVLVTRNGKPAAALVPIDEYEALEETAEILSDSATLAAIETGLAELVRGDTVTLEDLRRETAKLRAAR